MGLPPSPTGSTTSEDSSGSSASSIISIPISSPCSPSFKSVKICRVCGDRAKSNHFGGVSCDSCKAFFRRSVQSDAHKNFVCSYQRQCPINIASRKQCQYCRFQKCLYIGMEKSWVMTEVERQQMIRTRMQKKHKIERLTQIAISCTLNASTKSKANLADLKILTNYLSENEIRTLENFIQHYSSCFGKLSVSYENQTRNQSVILALFYAAIQQITQFAQYFKSFNNISSSDQQILLRNGVLELCFLRGAFIFDLQLDGWPLNLSASSDQQRSSFLAAQDLKPLVSGDLFEGQMRFIRLVKDIDVDECTLMLLCVVVLLNPDRLGLEATEQISKEQEEYLHLMRKFLNWRFGEFCGASLYPRLLLTLPELRQLSEAYINFSLFLRHDEIKHLQLGLSSIDLGRACNSKERSEQVASDGQADVDTEKDDQQSL